MNKLKNCHSAPGMGYSLAGTRLVNLRDCPACKYGTLDCKEHNWKCADCGKEFTDEELRKLGIIK